MTLPVSLSITGSSYNGAANPAHFAAGLNYENPAIGGSANSGNAYTNSAPGAMTIQLTALVSGLTPGVAYNIYIYQFTTSPLPSGALDIPTSNFNANANLASSTVSFTAAGSTYSTFVSVPSTYTVAFRCVPAGAP